MRATKAKAAVLHPKAKDAEVEAKAKAPDLPRAKAEGGTRPPRRLQPPKPSPHSDPSIKKERPSRNLPLLTQANEATVVSMATSPVTVANASVQNQRKLNNRQTTVSQPNELPSMLTTTI
jgi:hypothetical protein